MEQIFSNVFEDLRYERSLILPPSITESARLRKSKFTDHENDNIKNIALEKLYKQRFLKETIALDLLEKQVFE